MLKEKLYLEDEIRTELHFEEIIGESAERLLCLAAYVERAQMFPWKSAAAHRTVRMPAFKTWSAMLLEWLSRSSRVRVWDSGSRNALADNVCSSVTNRSRAEHRTGRRGRQPIRFQILFVAIKQRHAGKIVRHNAVTRSEIRGRSRCISRLDASVRLTSNNACRPRRCADGQRYLGIAREGSDAGP